MQFLRTNTATRITVGPFLDNTDGVTPETALTVTSEKLTFIVDTAGVPTLVLDVAPTASGGANDMVHVTGDDAGYYDLELAAADVNYLGRARLALTNAAAHCPVFMEFMILPASVYDSLVLGTDNLQVDTVQFAGQTVTAAAGVTLPSSVASPTNITAGTITTVTNLTNAPTSGDLTTTMKTSVENAVWNANASSHTSVGTFGANLDVAVSSVSGGSFTSADFGVIASGTAQSATSTTIRLAAATAFANDEILGATVLIASASAGAGQARQITDYDSSTDTATVDAWTTTPTGTITYRVFATAPASPTVLTPVNVTQWKGSTAPDMSGDAFARLGAPVGVSVSADIAGVKTDTASAVTKATDLQSRVPAALVSGRIDASVGAMAANTLTASALATDAVAEITVGVVDQTLTGHTTSGTVGGGINSASSAADPLSAAVGGYGAGTYGKLFEDNLNASVGSRASQVTLDTVDTIVDAIKAKTDGLTFTVSGNVDANIQAVNDVIIQGAGVEDTNEWRPA